VSKHQVHPSLESLLVSIEDLHPDPKNRRIHPERSIQELVKSYGEHGQRKPIVVQRKSDAGLPMVVRAGNGSLEAAKRLGWTHVAAIVIDENDREARAYAIRDNRTAEASEWDYAGLRDELADLSGYGYQTEDLGFTGGEAIEVIERAQHELDRPGKKVGPRTAKTAIEDAEPPPLPTKPVSQVGDVWTLGDHRLVIGDSTDLAVVRSALNNATADMTWTDPPWNVAIDAANPARGKQAGTKRVERTTIANDDLGDAFGPFLDSVMASVTAVMPPGAPIYVKMSSQEWATVDAALKKANFLWSSTIIWAKNSFVMSRKDYHPQYEPIWYGWKEGAARIHPNTDRTLSDLVTVDRPRVSKEHPTMTPVRLIAICLDASSVRGSRVLDLFGGSGTTAIACEQLGRRASLVELDPRYGDVIVERWQAFTGGKATRSRP
jgi:DNA modification methylase